MIVLVFLYMVGVIFIIGAEINAALMKFRVRADDSRAITSAVDARQEPLKAREGGGYRRR